MVVPGPERSHGVAIERAFEYRSAESFCRDANGLSELHVLSATRIFSTGPLQFAWPGSGPWRDPDGRRIAWQPGERNLFRERQGLFRAGMRYGVSPEDRSSGVRSPGDGGGYPLPEQIWLRASCPLSRILSAPRSDESLSTDRRRSSRSATPELLQ